MNTFFSISLMTLGGIIIIMNLSLPVRYYILKKRDTSTSLIPLIGGMLSCGGMAISGIKEFNQYAWVPLIVDLGCLPVVAILIWQWLKNRKSDTKRGSS